jgi:hypothetical protein
LFHSEEIMKKLEATQTLPENYQQITQLELSKNRGLAMILNLAGLGLLFGVGWLFLESLSFLRPAYVSSENILIITGMREFWRGILLLAVSVVLVIVLRETLHGLVLWIVTKQLPKLSFRGFYTYAAAPEWYLPRSDYLWISLVPLLVITVLGTIAVTFVPLNLVPGVMLLVSLNVAISVGDIVTAFWLVGKPKAILILDHGDGLKVFHDKGITDNL